MLEFVEDMFLFFMFFGVVEVFWRLEWFGVDRWIIIFRRWCGFVFIVFGSFCVLGFF